MVHTCSVVPFSRIIHYYLFLMFLSSYLFICTEAHFLVFHFFCFLRHIICRLELFNFFSGEFLHYHFVKLPFPHLSRLSVLNAGYSQDYLIQTHSIDSLYLPLSLPLGILNSRCRAAHSSSWAPFYLALIVGPN